MIVEVNRQDVSNVDEAFAAREGFKGNVMMLRVYAEGRHALLAVRLN